MDSIERTEIRNMMFLDFLKKGTDFDNEYPFCEDELKFFIGDFSKEQLFELAITAVDTIDYKYASNDWYHNGYWYFILETCLHGLDTNQIKKLKNKEKEYTKNDNTDYQKLENKKKECEDIKKKLTESLSIENIDVISKYGSELETLKRDIKNLELELEKRSPIKFYPVIDKFLKKKPEKSKIKEIKKDLVLVKQDIVD